MFCNRRMRLKENYKFQMYRQPSKGGPPALPEPQQDPLSLPGKLHSNFNLTLPPHALKTLNISDTILKELKGVLPAGVKLRSHSDDMDKSSNPVSPLKLSPRGHDNEEPRGAKLGSEDSDKDEASGSDEVCAKAIPSIRPIKAFDATVI